MKFILFETLTALFMGFLCERKDLIIRPADKGGIVLLKKTDYLNEMECLLSGRDTYTILKKDPINMYKKSLNSIVQDGYRKEIINERSWIFL